MDPDPLGQKQLDFLDPDPQKICGSTDPDPIPGYAKYQTKTKN